MSHPKPPKKPPSPSPSPDSAVRIYVRVRPLDLQQTASPHLHWKPSEGVVDVDAEVPSPVAADSSSGPESPAPHRALQTSPLRRKVPPSTPPTSPTPSRSRPHNGHFQFNGLFETDISSATVYQRTVEPLLEPLLEGYNVTVMAYGQSGSGKTYTMMGYHSQTGQSSDRGIIPRVVEDLYARIQAREEWTVRVTVSCIQVYLEKVLDLLDPVTANSDPETASSLLLRQRPIGGDSEEVYVEGVTWKTARTAAACLRRLEEANQQRVVASTDLNSVSSRSHAVSIIRIEQSHEASTSHLCSSLYLVDLAGSETVRRTHAQGLTLVQASHVNRSLSMLGNVISALSSRRSHVPYRDSKLTRLLTHALGGNSRTVMILTCSKAEVDLMETVSTLQFGKRARDMPNQPRVNKVLTLEDYKRLWEEAESTTHRQRLVIDSLEKENARLLHVYATGEKLVPAVHQVDDVRRRILRTTGEDETPETSVEESDEPSPEDQEAAPGDQESTQGDPETTQGDHEVGDPEASQVAAPESSYKTASQEAYQKATQEATPVTQETAVLDTAVLDTAVLDTPASPKAPKDQAVLETAVLDTPASPKDQDDDEVPANTPSRTSTARVVLANDETSEEFLDDFPTDENYDLGSPIGPRLPPLQPLQEDRNPYRFIPTPMRLEPVDSALQPRYTTSADDTTASSVTTLGIILLTVGAFLVTGAVVMLLVLHLRYQIAVPHWALMALWSGAAVGTFLIGWGLP